MPESKVLRSARWYVDQGWAVLPLDMKKKHPPIREWQNRAARDEASVEQWFTTQFPDAGVCLPTGEINDVVVIDVDPRNGGVEALAKAEKDLGALPNTLRSFSGRGDGGHHLFFEHPGGIVAAPRWFKEKYEGIDVKADKQSGGPGHQVVLPPSLHASTGKPYTWDGKPSLERLAPLPDAWVDALRPEDRDDAPDQVGDPTDTDLRYAEAALDSAVEQLEESKVGHDNNLLNENALSMYRMSLAGLLDWDEVTDRLKKAAAVSKTPGITDTMRSAAEAARRLGPKCGPDGEKGIWAGSTKDTGGKTTLVDKYLEEILARREAHRLADEIAMQAILEGSSRSRIMSGLEFVRDIPDVLPVLWGEGSEVLWVDGEGLLIVGDDGTGKSTIDHQLIAARLGLRWSKILGYPVEEAKGRIAYLAMDRPEQARRAMARLFPKEYTSKFEGSLQDRLGIWTGPPPVDILSRPQALADWVQNTFGQDVCEVHIDSLKDIAPKLSDDAVGSAVNRAIQECLARGINVVALHHQRKAGGTNPNPDSLADVFGSRWLTAGQGSVLMLLKGEEDDQDLVELKQLKQPMDRIRTSLVRHDRATGRSIVEEKQDDLEIILLDLGDAGGTVTEIAKRLYGTDAPSGTHRKKTTAHLIAYSKNDLAIKVGRGTGGRGGGSGERWYHATLAPSKP